MNLYGIYKRNTIDNVPEINALLDDTRDYCHRRGLHYVTCADVPGYMNEGCSTVHAREQFRYRTDDTKIIVSVEAL